MDRPAIDKTSAEADSSGRSSVDAAWVERARMLREHLNYEDEFIKAGEPYSEADEYGNVIIHPATTA